MVSIKDATKNRIDTGVPTESLQIRKQEKSKWEFQRSGIKAKKEELHSQTTISIHLCASSENN